MRVQAQQLLPVVRVGEIPREENPQRWLVEQLWGASSVGVIGGAPKCSKTWLGLDLALSVATGTPCLGKYTVPQAGPVLVYLAEDALPIVRERVEGTARHRGLELDAVQIHVITVPTLRLDRDPHRGQLFETAKRLRPRLLLDPFVRLHGVDENHATEVAELLAGIGGKDLGQNQRGPSLPQGSEPPRLETRFPTSTSERRRLSVHLFHAANTISERVAIAAKPPPECSGSSAQGPLAGH
jgi:hypothetical protein